MEVPQGGKEISTKKNYPFQAKILGVRSGDLKGSRRDVSREDTSPGQLSSQRQGYVATASSYIDDRHLLYWGECQGFLDDQFGLGARDENAGTDVKVHRPKLLDPRDGGQWTPGQPPGGQPDKTPFFGPGERPPRGRKKLFFAESRAVKNQKLGFQRREREFPEKGDACGEELPKRAQLKRWESAISF